MRFATVVAALPIPNFGALHGSKRVHAPEINHLVVCQSTFRSVGTYTHDVGIFFLLMPILDPDDYLSYIVYDEVRGGWCLTEEGQWLLVQEMIARTKGLDRLDVIEGRKPPTYTYFIQPEMVKGATVIWPKKYTPS